MNKDKIVIKFKPKTINTSIDKVIKLAINNDKYGTSLLFNTESGELSLINENGVVLSAIDLPTEQLVKNVYFDDENKDLVVEWENGQVTNIPLDDLFTSNIVKITYDELKELRDNSQLVIGRKYRIIDYETMTIQEGTKSAGHPFDVIVTAISENQLDENARICIRDGDTYFGEWDEEIETITGEFVDGTEPENIEVYFTAMVDDLGDNFKEYEGLKGGSDIIVELDYKENNLGVVVPIFYKNDAGYVESGEEGTDYQDTFYYVGTEEIDGETYDKWIKIEDSGQFGWTTESKIYAYTNNVVNKEVVSGIKHHKEHSLDNIEIKYCLDNDTNRFAWTPNEFMIYTDDSCWFKMDGEIEIEGTKYYKWENNYFGEGEYLLSKTLDFELGDKLDYYSSSNDYFEEDYSTLENTTNAGKGVIYFMKDEWGNQCPYDFKNILFREWDIMGDGEEHWFYTFSYYDFVNILDGTMQEFVDDEGIKCTFINNVINDCFVSNYEVGITMLTIPFGNIFYVDFNDKNDFDVKNNYLGHNCEGNKFLHSCVNIKLGDDCSHNTLKGGSIKLGDRCHSNTFNEYSWDVTLGQDCMNNTFEFGILNSSFGENCFGNWFKGEVDKVSFENYVTSNEFVSVKNSSFGNDCYNNYFKDYIENSSFGNECYHNNIYGHIESSSFGNNLGENRFNIILNTSIGNDCYYNRNGSLDGKQITFHTASIGDGFNHNKFASIWRSVIGDDCYSNDFVDVIVSSIGNKWAHNDMRRINYCSIENEFVSNTFNGEIEYCSFGNSFKENTIDEEMYNSSFGNNIYKNNFTGQINDVSFGNNIYENNFGIMTDVTMGNDIYENNFNSDSGIWYSSFGNEIVSNDITGRLYRVSFGNGITDNTIEGSLEGVSFGNSIHNNKIYSNITYSSFGNRIIFNEFTSRIKHSHFGNEVSNINLSDTLEKVDAFYPTVKIDIQNGVSGASIQNKLNIHISNNVPQNIQVQIEKDTKGQILMYWNDDKLKKVGYYKESNIADEWLEMPIESGEGGLTASVSNGTLKLSSNSSKN